MEETTTVNHFILRLMSKFGGMMSLPSGSIAKMYSENRLEKLFNYPLHQIGHESSKYHIYNVLINILQVCLDIIVICPI